jgi:hypothetical protein
MSAKRVKEILAAHADALVTDGAANPALDDLPDRPGETKALMEIAERTQHALQPIPPPPVFRARLHDGLRMAARLQQAHSPAGLRRSEPAWGWLIGAAALGSAAGVIAIVLRSRAQTHKSTAHLQN